MKNKFVDHGFHWLRRGQKALSMEAIEKKYADKLAGADASTQLKIREQMVEEFQRQKNHKPSAGTLW
jgi:hypothetical protein